MSLSSGAPEALKSWKTSPRKGSEAKHAGQFQPGGGLAYASCQWRGQVSCDLAPRMLSLSSLTCFHKPHASFVSHLLGFGNPSVC